MLESWEEDKKNILETIAKLTGCAGDRSHEEKEKTKEPAELGVNLYHRVKMLFATIDLQESAIDQLKKREKELIYVNGLWIEKALQLTADKKELVGGLEPFAEMNEKDGADLFPNLQKAADLVAKHKEGK